MTDSMAIDDCTRARARTLALANALGDLRIAQAALDVATESMVKAAATVLQARKSVEVLQAQVAVDVSAALLSAVKKMEASSPLRPRAILIREEREEVNA